MGMKLREYLDIRGRKYQEARENCKLRNFLILYFSSNIARITKSRNAWNKG
jgi:hypothetical protein